KAKVGEHARGCHVASDERVADVDEDPRPGRVGRVREVNEHPVPRLEGVPPGGRRHLLRGRPRRRERRDADAGDAVLRLRHLVHAPERRGPGGGPDGTGLCRRGGTAPASGRGRGGRGAREHQAGGDGQTGGGEGGACAHAGESMSGPAPRASRSFGLALRQRSEAHDAGCPRYCWAKRTAMLPSPTAAATRLTELARTSPTANTPGRLVSRR